MKIPACRPVPAIIAAMALAILVSGCHADRVQAEHFDTLIVGGEVIDGTGASAAAADIGIRDGRIAAVGDLNGATADLRIDARGQVVSPGFIDVHSHADLDIVQEAFRAAPGMIRQGVTTAVFGVDGGHSLAEIRRLRGLMQANGVGVNHVFFAGHNGIRHDVMGMDDRAPSEDEMARMREQVRLAMEEGAAGLSTGLMYLPGNYASTEEVVELARAVQPYGGIYDSHDRDPGFRLLWSVGECLQIGREAGVATNVAHLKAVGLRHAGLTPRLIEMIEQARANGEDVTADVYPYDGATTRLAVEVLVPPPDSSLARNQALLADATTEASVRAQALQDLVSEWRTVLDNPGQRAAIRKRTENPPTGQYSWITAVGYDSFRIVSSARPELVDRMIYTLAQERSTTPFDVLAGLIEDEGASARLTMGSIAEEEVRMLLRQPWVMISSDGKEGGIAGGRGHPRYRGSFARVLAYYVREQRVLTLPEAVHRMSGLSARYLRLADRGTIRAGAWADVMVFDPARIQDNATWDDPAAYATGVSHVFVNGVPTLVDGEPTGSLSGRYLPFRESAAATPTP